MEIPTNWKMTKNVSVFKRGDCNCFENYRGISILNSTCKRYGKIINNRLMPLMDSLLLEEQLDEEDPVLMMSLLQNR